MRASWSNEPAPPRKPGMRTTTASAARARRGPLAPRQRSDSMVSHAFGWVALPAGSGARTRTAVSVTFAAPRACERTLAWLTVAALAGAARASAERPAAARERSTEQAYGAATVPRMPVSETVALVLAGGGARGAYEVGALSALLPALEAEGRRPSLVLGASVGALNTAFIAATAHRPSDEVLAEGRRIWSEVTYDQVLSGLGSLRGLGRLGAYLAEAVGLPVRALSLLDPAPLPATIERLIDFGQLNENAAAGLVHAGVVTTAAATSRSVVFHTGAPSPPPDEKRGIDYARTQLAPAHVLASAAIPSLFPAVRIERPARVRGWHWDGGTRLNVPLKPALTLGADRVVVIGLNSVARPGPRSGRARPDLLEGAAQILQAVLVDPLVNDVATLATANVQVASVERAGGEIPGRRSVPYVFVAPARPDAIGRIAADVFREVYAPPKGLLRSADLAVLGRLVAGDRAPAHGELLSSLLFAPEFTRRLLELGRRDAERWLEQAHDDGIWRVGSSPP